MSTTPYSDDDNFLDRIQSRGFWRRLAMLVAVPLFVFLVLFIVLWRTFFHYVKPGHMLIIISKSGDPLGPGQILADPGQKGVLRDVLGEGYHFVMPILYTTELASMEKHNMVVPPGKVGIVNSLDGKEPADGGVLANEGEKGIRREVLLPGNYRLNPYGYRVELVDMVKIAPGFIGVKRRLLGKDPRPTRDGKPQLFATGPDEKGIIRDEILQPGIYPVNTKEYEVLARDIGIYQTTYYYPRRANDKPPLTFPAKDGNQISLDCTIEWEIKPENWPVWLAKFGDLRTIERIVIDQHVRKICRDRGFNYGAQDFLEGEKREKFQLDFRAELDKVCKEDNVVVRSAFIRNIIIPDNFLEQKRLEHLAVEERLTSEQLTLTRETESLVADAMSTIEVEVGKVRAGTERLVASVERETENIKIITDAELERMRDEYAAKVALVEAQRKRALGEAEAEATKVKETASAAIYKLKLDVFGRDGDAYLRYTMAQQLNPKMRLRLFQSGPGTLWTNMGNKDMNLFMPLPSGESKPAK